MSRVPTDHQAPSQERVTDCYNEKPRRDAHPEAQEEQELVKATVAGVMDRRSTLRTRKLLVTKKYVVGGDRGRGVDVSGRRAQAWSDQDGNQCSGCGADASRGIAQA